MTNAQKLAIRLSEIRQKLNELSGKDELTEAEETDLRSLSTEYPKLEERHRAALISESVEEAEALDGEDGDGEDRERSELRSRSRLAKYVSASARRAPGRGCRGGAIGGCRLPRRGAPGAVRGPALGHRRPERRAVTPAPATTDENLAPIVPAIFDRSAAAWLGIEMPTVATGDAGFPVLSTSVTGGPVAKSLRRRRKRRARSR